MEQKISSFMLEGISRDIDAIELKRALNKQPFGKLLKVKVLSNRDGSGRGVAFVAYETSRCTLRPGKNIQIGSRYVKVKVPQMPEDVGFDHKQLLDIKVSDINIEFGLNFKSRTYQTVPYIEIPRHAKPKMRLDMQKRRILFTFHEGNIRSKVEIFMTHITSGVQTKIEGSTYEIQFLCTSVPLFYKYDEEDRDKQWAWTLQNDSKVFKRTIGFWRDRSDCLRKLMIKNLHFRVNARKDNILAFMDGLQTYNLLDERWIRTGYALILSPKLDFQQFVSIDLPYSVKYLLLCFLSHCYFNVYMTTPTFLDYLSGLCRTDLSAVELCLEKLFIQCDTLKLVSIEDPQEFFQAAFEVLDSIP